jgi:aspartate kinase
MRMGVRVRVLSSFQKGPGTLIVDEDEIVEQAEVTGVAYSLNDAKITLLEVEDRPGVAAGIFGSLADAGINVDMIVQNISENGRSTDMTFTVSATDAERAVRVIETIRERIPFKSMRTDKKVAKISVVGVGMRSHAGVAQKMFATLAEKGINIQVISTSEIKISVLIASDYHELAVRALHAAYGLDAG